MKKIFTVLSYPLILIISIFLGIYLIIRSLFSSTYISIENKPVNIKNYSIYFECNKLKIYSIYAGEIRMGPIYMGFITEPRIQEIETEIYGDWFYKTEEGIFLQRWNSTKVPNTDLIFIDFKNLNIQTIKSNILSVTWKIKNINGELIFDDFLGTAFAIKSETT